MTPDGHLVGRPQVAGGIGHTIYMGYETEAVWRMEVRALRELLIEIGERLLARGVAIPIPGIPSWVQAFSHWDQT